MMAIQAINQIRLCSKVSAAAATGVLGDDRQAKQASESVRRPANAIQAEIHINGTGGNIRATAPAQLRSFLSTMMREGKVQRYLDMLGHAVFNSAVHVVPPRPIAV